MCLKDWGKKSDYNFTKYFLLQRKIQFHYSVYMPVPGTRDLQVELYMCLKLSTYISLAVARMVHALQDQRIYGGDSDGLQLMERLILNIPIQNS